MAASFIAIACGATTAPLNPAYRTEEFEFYLSDLNAKALLILKSMESPALAVAKARANDKRPGAGAYYDSVAAEVALGSGDYARAIQLAERALGGLGPSVVSLPARVMAVAAEAGRTRPVKVAEARPETRKRRRSMAAL